MRCSRWAKGRVEGRGGGGREGDHNYNAIFDSNAAELYFCRRQLFLSGEQGGEGEKGGGRGGGEGGGQQRGRGGDHNCNAIFPSSGAELYSWAKAIVSFQ